jgi:molybdopterin molybdotransferase
VTQLLDDCFAFGGPLMTVDAAVAVLMERVRPLGETETAPLGRALGRVLAEDVTAAADAPPHANAAVDGWAFRHADLRPGETRLAAAGRATAGHPFAGEVAAGAAVRIFTGAVLPDGTDTVVMQEDARTEGDAVIVPAGLKAGANRRKAGEDLKRGQLALAAGRRLQPQDLALAAAAGRASLRLHRRLRVALFSTGDELAEAGAPLAPGAIWDANRPMLAALLARLDAEVTDLGLLPDRADAVVDALRRSAGTHDVLLTSGGVSTGEEDHVRAAVERLGLLHFWRLAVKPGRPVALGHVGAATFVGLPGNPVAAFACFLRFARPLLLRLAGCGDTAPRLYPVAAAFEHRKRAGRREWLRARLAPTADGGLAAEKFERQGSGLITGLVQSDGLVELAEDVTEVARGARVPFLPFAEALA